MEPAIRLLFVDSDTGRRESAVEQLETASDRIRTTVCGSVAEARGLLADQSLDCVVAASSLPGGGLGLFEAVRTVDESLPVLLLVEGSVDTSSEALEAGVTDVVPYAEGIAAVLLDRIESHAESRSAGPTAETARRQYEAFVDNVPGIVYRSPVDRAGAFDSVYGRCELVSGYTKSALETDVVWLDDVVHPADRGAVNEAVDAAVENGDRFEVTYRIQTQSGDERWVRDRGWEVDTTDGILEGLVTDVTDQAERERQLKREHQRFSDLFSNSPEPTIAYGFEDGTTVFEQVNTAFESLFGLRGSEVRGESVNELLVPPAEQSESEEIDRQVETGGMVDRVVTRQAADGSRIFNLRSIPVESSGAIDGFAVYRDITERRQRQRELERYETIVETMPMGIFVVNEDGVMVNVNQPAATILGYTVEELQGESFDRFVADGVVSESIVEEYQQSIDALLSGDLDREKAVLEAEVTRADSKSRILEVHTALLPTDDGFNGSVQVFHDITERTENQRELERQNERLAEFASIVSHDLRNPLNIAQGNLDLATQECDSEYLGTVENALGRMETLIGETLELARQGEMVTETEPVDLADIATGCWQMVETDDASLDVETGLTIQGDPERVKQLFENLFRNSVEHVGPTVTITVGTLSDGFYVADDGPGIPPEERTDVFEAGYTTSEDGTGFGLPIVKTIVEAHNWSITVTESENGGVCFEITDSVTQ